MSEFRISNKTDYDVRFMPEGNKELLKLTPDGECYWNGRLVESDEDFKAAIISVSKYFIGASQPYHATIDRLTAELAEARDRLQEERDTRHERFLEWRGIYTDDGGKPCKDCSGTGYKAYGSTSTWHGGAGGQAITSGVCDKCWGSGDINNPWTNLRNLYGLKSRAEQAEAELARYKQGVEVEVESYLAHMGIDWIELPMPKQFIGQRIRVLVMKEVE